MFAGIPPSWANFFFVRVCAVRAKQKNKFCYSAILSLIADLKMKRSLKKRHNKMNRLQKDENISFIQQFFSCWRFRSSFSIYFYRLHLVFCIKRMCLIFAHIHIVLFFNCIVATDKMSLPVLSSTISIRLNSLMSIKLMIKLLHQNFEWKESSPFRWLYIFFLLNIVWDIRIAIRFSATETKKKCIKNQARFHFELVSFSVSSSRFITTVW